MERSMTTGARGRDHGERFSRALEIAEQALVKAWQKADEVERAQLRIAHGIVLHVLDQRAGEPGARPQLTDMAGRIGRAAGRRRASGG